MILHKLKISDLPVLKLHANVIEAICSGAARYHLRLMNVNPFVHLLGACISFVSKIPAAG